MNIVKRVWKFLIFTNLLIAMAAASQVLLSYQIFGVPYNIHVVILEFSSTLLLYNLSLWLSKPQRYKESPYERTRWVFGNMPVFWILSLVAALSMGYALLQVHGMTFLFLLFIGMLSLAYVLPVFNINGVRKGFRHMAYLKVFHIALIWTLSTVGLVFVEAKSGSETLDGSLLVFLLASKFLFMLLVTLPFDIRDMSQDSYYHLKTVPLALGKERAIGLCYALGLLHLWAVWFMPTMLSVRLSLIGCDVLVLILFRTVIFKEGASFLRVYLLDLILVLQYLICLLAVQVSNNFVG